eukprot:6185421-Amphidinium_carterae.1
MAVAPLSSLGTLPSSSETLPVSPRRACMHVKYNVGYEATSIHDIHDPLQEPFSWLASPCPLRPMLVCPNRRHAPPQRVQGNLNLASVESSANYCSIWSSMLEEFHQASNIVLL